MGAVIDEKAFTKISGYLDDAKKNAKVIQGGGADGDDGYFIEPTLVETTDPGYRLLCEEIFGPVVTVYVYPDAKWAETLDARRPHVALRAHRRGVRARSRGGARGDRARCATRPATSTSTTSRPARSSASSRSAARARRGTNDKAGSKLNLVRWVSARTIKETFVPPTAFDYPFMGEE